MAVSLVEAGLNVGNYFFGGGGGGRGSISTIVFPSGTYANAAPGDLIVAVVASSKQIASFSSNWTQIVNTGAGSSWVAAFYRVLAGGVYPGPDDLAVTWQATNPSWTANFAFLRSPTGFDSTCIKSNQQNAATNAGASYALGVSLSGVSAGELSIAIGGAHSLTGYMSNTCGVSGTAWTLQAAGGTPGYTGGTCTMVATCPTTGTPAVPSVTYNVSGQSMNKFIFAAVIREAPAQPPAGGGLFWG